MSTDVCAIVSAVGKKTKRQKIIADQRRKSNLSSFPVQEIGSNQTPSRVQTTTLYPPSSGIQNESLYIYPVHLIKKDLTKTLLLSILAISLELALFLVLEKHLILPFRI
ncbi:hypothetical protein COT03_01970 [Candidatus Shapirobacteria bacterium CG07_land_8_20_14_0_80_39_18]|uniref:Uncharacterized protein n=1 Tax=Candidatus Shapirobacteria bacterium CG07_land_8_20_14_0_80_39_18 TaxID=1974882 RepID=A0A2M6YR70_9BACT|nr:MAG: hypothetical protein COT03_01970 [Candidatus Shapirobacteria bacterium CG07_land_8_20_14_0_80_39_18]